MLCAPEIGKMPLPLRSVMVMLPQILSNGTACVQDGVITPK
jgi:hypothetical protein